MHMGTPANFSNSAMRGLHGTSAHREWNCLTHDAHSQSLLNTNTQALHPIFNLQIVLL